MAELLVTRRFTFNRDDGTSATFEPGLRPFSEEDAAHWYVQAHTQTPEELQAPVVGNREPAAGKDGVQGAAPTGEPGAPPAGEAPAGGAPAPGKPEGELTDEQLKEKAKAEAASLAKGGGSKGNRAD